MYKICFFVPEAEADKVKRAMFEAGAGRIGQYDRCSWQTIGNGQFRPLDGSQPYIGTQDRLEIIEELKVEMVTDDICIRDVVSALKSSHPYETPAYEVYKLEDF